LIKCVLGVFGGGDRNIRYWLEKGDDGALDWFIIYAERRGLREFF
jgi:hypothetical protein